MLQRRRHGLTCRMVIPVDVQTFIGSIDITRSVRTRDAREASRRQTCWKSPMYSLLNHVRRHGDLMTREELDELTQRYLLQSFDEIEARLALDWSPAGLAEYSFQLNERCHDLSGTLADGDLSAVIKLAQGLAPDSDELS